MSDKLLNVRIDYISPDQAVDQVSGWLGKRSKHYIVTPNPEMLVDAHFDNEFMYVLNHSDMAIPDSPRLGWGSYLQDKKGWFSRLILTPFFLFPQFLTGSKYPVTPGVDLMERLLSLSEEKGLTTAYLGGTKRVADKLLKCLRLKYPRLKIAFCSGNMQVNERGEIYFDTQQYLLTQSKQIMEESGGEKQESRVKSQGSGDKSQESRVRGQESRVKGQGTRVQSPESRSYGRVRDSFNHHLLSEKIDLMFVAFGHKKQEKWIYKNLPKLNTKVMMGVGGAFDYLAGAVPRAPKIMRNAGLEWLFRVFIQPWRIKRFWKLIYYIYMVIRSKPR